MGGAERISDLCDQMGSPTWVEPALLRQKSLQAPAFDPAHGDEEQTLLLPSVVDRDDIRVVDRGGRLALSFKAGPEPRVARELRGKDLQGHGTAERHVCGPVDHAHAPTAGDGRDDVPGEG